MGAIAGESGIPGKLIGTIDMFDKYTFVEVPREYAQDVLNAMNHTKIKGKSVAVEAGKSEIIKLDWLKNTITGHFHLSTLVVG